VSRVWRLLIPISALVALLVDVAGAPALVRTPAMFWFLLVCPGMAVVAHVGVARTSIRWTLAVAVSAAVDILVGELFLYTNTWHPLPLLLGLGAISTAVIIAAPDLRRDPVSGGPVSDAPVVFVSRRRPRPFQIVDVTVSLDLPGDAQPDQATRGGRVIRKARPFQIVDVAVSLSAARSTGVSPAASTKVPRT
jgi:hypothetical protein